MATQVSTRSFEHPGRIRPRGRSNPSTTVPSTSSRSPASVRQQAGPADPGQGRAQRDDYEIGRARYPRELVERSLDLCPAHLHHEAGPTRNTTSSISNKNTYSGLIAGMRAVDIDTGAPLPRSRRTTTPAGSAAAASKYVHGALHVLHAVLGSSADEPPAMILPISTWSRLKYFSKDLRAWGRRWDSDIFELQMAQAIGVDVWAATEAAPPLSIRRSPPLTAVSLVPRLGDDGRARRTVGAGRWHIR